MAGAVVKPAKPANSAPPDPPQPGKRDPTKLITIGAILAIVTSVQIVTTYLLTPKSADTPIEKHDEPEHTAKVQRSPRSTAPSPDFTEVAVGDFSFSNTAAMRNAITFVAFKLSAVAPPMQASNLEDQIVRNQDRIRAAVNKIVRNSNLEELYDPSLETIKRLIRQEMNELVGNNLVTEVVINDIRIIQQ